MVMVVVSVLWGAAPLLLKPHCQRPSYASSIILCLQHFILGLMGSGMSKIMTHAMRAAGLNDVTLAALIGCSQSHINRIRNGKMVPRRVMANAIERALSVQGLADELTKKERDNA
jgi:hypothetical protein